MVSSSSSSSGINAFDTYYQEFASLLHNLEKPDESNTAPAATAMKAAAPSSSSSNNIDNTSNNDKVELHKQCSDLLRLMTLEARSTTNDPDLKLERLERVKIYKFQLEAVQQSMDQEFLMGDTAARMLQLEKERHQVRSILERTEGRAAQQNELLERARRSLQETEEIGLEIIEETRRNRETLESAQGHVNEVTGMAARASKLVKALSKPWWMPRR